MIEHEKICKSEVEGMIWDLKLKYPKKFQFRKISNHANGTIFICQKSSYFHLTEWSVEWTSEPESALWIEYFFFGKWLNFSFFTRRLLVGDCPYVCVLIWIYTWRSQTQQCTTSNFNAIQLFRIVSTPECENRQWHIPLNGPLYSSSSCVSRNELCAV